MAHDVAMPRLSDSMTEGTVLKWLKANGEAVHCGDELVEIETDKATITYEADHDGILEIVVGDGETAAVGALIACLNGAALDRSPAPIAQSSQASIAVPDTSGSTASGSSAAPVADQRVNVSPVARRIASEHSIDLLSLRGSGRGGRVVRADVEAVLLGGADPGEQNSDVAAPKGPTTIEQPTAAQRIIARRMTESRATIPSFDLRAEIDMERCADLRDQLAAPDADPLPSYNDFIVRATALALIDHPRVNGAYRDGHFELYGRTNIGIAVAAPETLVVPTVFDADRKSLRTVAAETRALVERVRSGAITPAELSGATFTISNLGAHGVVDFAAVINPPQAAILAVGAITPRPVARNAAVEVRRTMIVTLSCDHRILSGIDGARFLSQVRQLLEKPVALLGR